MIVLLVGVLMLSALMPAYAQNMTEPDLSKKGSISISLNDEGVALSSAEFTLYRVAEITENNGIYEYKFVEAFANSGKSVDDLSDEETAEILAEYAKKHKISGISDKTDKNGFVKFNDLVLGMYLAVQTGSVADFADCTPFLVSVPLNELGDYVYDVDATPKTDVVRLVDVSVKIVWNDNGNEHPKSVTVQLIKGGKVIDTVDLSDANKWCYVWTDMPGSDSYSVKIINIPKGYTPTYKQDGLEFTVINTSKLIQTGQLNWPVPLMAGSGLLLFVIGWVIVFLKEKKRS